MSYTVGRGTEIAQPGSEKPGEKLSLGVAARLSRYLQVLTQARKMGKETISSQELADYTHVNSTQIRRDLSGFGKFGKRGVGYNVDSLVTQIRKILRTSGQHNIALFGAGHLGTAIATSDIFADHGFRVVAVFDVDQRKVGTTIGSLSVRHSSEMATVIDEEDIVVAVLAVPSAAAQARRGRAGRGRREDHLQLLRRPAPGSARGDRAHLQPRRRSALRAVLLPDLIAARDMDLDLDRARAAFDASTDFTVGLEEEFAVLDARDLGLVPRFEELRDAATADPVLAESIAGELISSEIEIRSGRAEDVAAAHAAQRGAAGGCSRWRPSTESRSGRPARIRGPTTASRTSSTPSTTTGSRMG